MLAGVVNALDGLEMDGVMGAVLHADTAAAAVLYLDHGLRRGVQLELAGHAGTAHAHVLDGASESGLLVPLEVREGYEHVGVHDGRAYLGRLAVGAALDGELAAVGTLDAVGDDHVASGAEAVETVAGRAFEMVHGVGAASGVEGVAVSQVGLSAEGTHQVGHAGCVVGPEEGQVAGLAEVHFYGDELVLEIYLLDAGGLGHGFHLLH